MEQSTSELILDANITLPCTRGRGRPRKQQQEQDQSPKVRVGRPCLDPEERDRRLKQRRDKYYEKHHETILEKNRLAYEQRRSPTTRTYRKWLKDPDSVQVPGNGSV